ncbi:MAG: PAS-domain containing protein [Alphaproteobacteria bacterium]
MSEGVAIFGPDKRMIFHNRAFATMWGLDPAFLADRPTHAALLDHLKEKRKLPAHSNYAEWRAGELALYQEIADLPEALWVLPEGRSLRVTRQRHPLGGLLLIFADRTDELTLKSQYNALLQVQRAALDRLHEGVVVFGLDGKMKLYNAAFATMWELSEEDLAGQITFDRLMDLTLPLFHQRATWSAVKARITDPSPAARQEFRGEMERTDGTVVTFLTRPLPDGATLVAFLDISATKKVEHALRDRAEAFEAADRLKTEFVQNVSYQLRTPLQAIQGYAEVLSQGYSGPLNQRQKDHVGVVLQASHRLSELVDNILDIAMIEAGRMELELADIDLDSTMKGSSLHGRQPSGRHRGFVDRRLRAEPWHAAGRSQAHQSKCCST